MVKNQNLFKMTLTAMFCAIVIAMTFIPYVGYITYGLLSITTLHVIVILGAIILGPASGTLIGLVWGVTCLIYAAMNGTADAAIFLDPRISVIPRILVGFAAGWFFKLLNPLFAKLIHNQNGAIATSSAITGALGTATNTALVLTAISLFGGSGVLKLGVVLNKIISVALTLNGAIELVLAVVIVPALSVPLFKYLRKHRSQIS